MLIPWLGRSSVGVIEHMHSAIDCITIMPVLDPKLLASSNFCPLSLVLPELLHFLKKPRKTQKTQKENKIEQNNKN